MFTSVLAPLRPAARIFTGSTYVLLGFDALRAPGTGSVTDVKLLAAQLFNETWRLLEV